MNTFKEIDVVDIEKNVFDLLNKWMIVSVQKSDGSINALTAGWGGFGVLWRKNVAYIWISPARYTYDFIEDSSTFSLNFFDESYRDSLVYFGKVSGRDEDKISKSNLSLAFDEGEAYFNDADMIMICEKIYKQPLDLNGFINNDECETFYDGDNPMIKIPHTLYIGEIKKILVK